MDHKEKQPLECHLLGSYHSIVNISY
ncbi:hypothetical protein Gotri_005679, partial [Gossypium trilobum]|nr:hypothetical protein [Gossypium trilobum]